MSDEKGDWFPTPATAQPPRLVEVAPDDPAVRALTLPPPLAPIDDDETPPPVANPNDPQVLARKEQLRVVANADLLLAFREQHASDDRASLSERVFALEIWRTQAELDIRNLTALVRDLLRRNVGA